MPKSFNYYPHGIYNFMQNIAYQNHLSIKEVETAFLRHMCQEMGFVCDHQDIKFTDATGKQKGESKAYCRSCWTRMEIVKQGIYDWQGLQTKAPEVFPKRTFLDEWLKQQRENEPLHSLNTLKEEK